MAEIREADLPKDLKSVEHLWLEYLTWANDELESRHGFHLPVQEALEHDVATIAKFQPPDGRLLLAVDAEAVVGTACMKRIGSLIAEIKRMYVQPSHRGAGLGGMMLDRLVADARTVGYERIRLDSPDFLIAAHGLYRSSGFIGIRPYAESEIPDEFKPHAVFMEKILD